MHAHILCIGDVMLDVITHIEMMPADIKFGSDNASTISTHGGGAAGNVASWVTRVGSESTIVAHVGSDSAGAAIISEFDALGVNHKGLLIESAHTGVVVVLVDPSGERTMFPENGANAGLVLEDLPALEGFDAVYLSGYAPLDPKSRPGILEMLPMIRSHNIPIYYDPATVGGMSAVPIDMIRGWLSHVDGILLNEEEAAFLSGLSDLDSQLDYFLEKCSTVVIKRGAEGAIGKIRGGNRIDVPAFPTTVVDTTGAGDSFAGGFISSMALGRGLEESLRLGAKVAARCVAIVGARPHVDTRISQD